jgi:hypothetical protein
MEEKTTRRRGQHIGAVMSLPVFAQVFPTQGGALPKVDIEGLFPDQSFFLAPEDPKDGKPRV